MKTLIAAALAATLTAGPASAEDFACGDFTIGFDLSALDALTPILRGEGDAERIRIFGEAVSADPEFYAFLRSMEAYGRAFSSDDTTMVLTPDSEFFEYFDVSPGLGD